MDSGVKIKTAGHDGPAVQFGVILKQPAAGQAKEKFFSVRTFQGAAGETE